MARSICSPILMVVVIICLFASSAHAFGAGNIASISAIEGKNWRHGDIEDVLKTVACIKGHKWTSMMIKRVYFGNWLRDYSQAMDTGALKKAQPESIRILVWILAFLSFGYATAEFEVTSERLGVYRPEEHIDNPKDYNDNQDARPYDARLRGPIRDVELQIDPDTGMKNYIANPKADWATSAAFVKYSFERSIHYGRLYCGGSGFFQGKDEDLAEALRCLGQGLHTLEDFGAHTNYVELALRELGFNNVFAHTGTNTMITLHGKRVYPLVTGTFGMVDFYHSVLGEASDHFVQSEVNEMDNALGTAQQAAQSSNPVWTLVKLLSKVPGTRELCDEAIQLQRASEIQARQNTASGQGTWGGLESWESFGSRGAGDQSGGQVTQPEWSGLQVVNPQPDTFGQQHNWPQNQQSGWNQPPQPEWNTSGHSAWNEPAQPSWNAQQSQWTPQHDPTHDSSLPQGQNFNDQHAGVGSYHQNQPASAFGQSTGFDQSSNQTPAQTSGQGFPPQPPGQSFNQAVDAQIATATQPTPTQPQQAPTGNIQGLPGLPNFDPVQTIKQIYPILAFRDKVVRTISAVIEKIPGLEALVDKITETLTVFILSLLAPFVRPVLAALTKTLQFGSAGVVESSGRHQYEPWTDPNCTDPTHSMLSKDHFSNILNQPAGAVAAEILKYVAPRVLYAWQNTSVPVEKVMDDCMKVFHHPAIRDNSIEVHRTMFDTVQKWVHNRSDGGSGLNDILSSDGVRNGKNQKATDDHSGHQHGAAPSFASMGGFQHHSHSAGFNPLSQLSHLPIPGLQNVTTKINKFSSFIPGGLPGMHRGIDEGGSRGFDSDATGHGYDVNTAGRGMEHESNEPHAFMPPKGYEQYE